MTVITFNQLLKNAQQDVDELQPWDVEAAEAYHIPRVNDDQLGP